jgi:acyl-ACP thioesterase
MDTRIPLPSDGRTFSASRSVHLADLDRTGRVRFDAIARFLQDVAIDDVAQTGWGAPEHLWFVRRIRVDVITPLLADRTVRLVTWCSGVAAIAAGRRWSLVGDRGGRVEVDSVWIHLDAGARPARIDGFGVYAGATAGRAVSTRFALPDPPAGATRVPWALRSTDVDLHGHVNNAVHWQVVEDVLVEPGLVDPTLPVRAELDYRSPLDLDDAPIATWFSDGDGLGLALLAGDEVRAVARLGPLPG